MDRLLWRASDLRNDAKEIAKQPTFPAVLKQVKRLLTRLARATRLLALLLRQAHGQSTA